MNLFRKLIRDERGVIISSELVMVATILVIGLVVGMAALRDAVTSEISDVAGAIQDVNQSYTIGSVTGHSTAVAGFDFVDEVDFCDDPEDLPLFPDNCIFIDPLDAIDEGAPAPVGLP